jgi:uncharacterized protein
LINTIIPYLSDADPNEVYKNIALKNNCLNEFDLEEIISNIQRLKNKYNIFSCSRPKERGFIPPPDIENITGAYEQRATQQLILEITRQCNLRCRYCVYSGKYYYHRMHSPDSMSTDIAKRSIDFYLEKHKNAKNANNDMPPMVGFYGGEPLLCIETIKDCIGYLNNLKRNGSFPNILIRICTNGTLLNQENIDFFIDNSITLQISIDGPRCHHDRNRIFKNGAGTYDRLMRNMEMIYKKSPSYYRENVVFTCTVTPSANMAELNEYFLNDPFVKNNLITTGSVESEDNTYFEDCILNFNQKTEYKQLEEIFIQNKISGKEGKATFLDTELNNKYAKLYKRSIHCSNFDIFPIYGPCEPGLRKLFVSVNGTFYPCEKINLNFPIGDIFNGFDYKKIFKMWTDFIRLMNREECLQCWAARFCGNCFASVGKDGYFEITRRRSFCKVTKAGIQKNLTVFASLLEKNPKIANEWENTIIM